MALPVTITGISTAVAPVGPFKVAAGNYPVVALDTASVASGDYSTFDSPTRGIAQTFTAGVGGLVVFSATAQLSKTGSPTDNVYAEIRATDPNGSLLATSNLVACSTITGTTYADAGTVTFLFSSPPTISASASFAVCILRTGTDAVNYPRVARNVGVSSYAGGYSYTCTGGTWTGNTLAEVSMKINTAVTLATDAYYFFGRDGTTATTLQAYKAGATELIYTIVQGTSSSTTWGNGNSTSKTYQTFTTGVSSTVIVSVGWTIGKTGSPTDNLTADIYLLDTGTSRPTGSSLGTSSSIAASALTTGAVERTFIFTTPVAISPSTQYAVVISRSGAVDAANYFKDYEGVTANVDVSQSAGYWNATTLAWSSIPSDRVLKVFGPFLGGPDTVWASVTTKTGFTTAILNLSAYQVGSVIHMLVNDGTASTSVATKYLSFDMMTEAFLATTETVAAASAVAGQMGATVFHGSLVVRSTGEVVAFYNGLQTNTSGTPRARLYYSRRTGVNTWAAAVRVDANTGIDNIAYDACIAPNDRVHFLFYAPTNTSYRTLSAANALGALTAYSASALPAGGQMGSGTYVSGGTTYFISSLANLIHYGVSTDTTMTLATTSSAVDGFPTPYICTNTMFDGTDIYQVYIANANSDAYVLRSADRAAANNVGIVTLANITGQGLSKDGKIYQRGSDVVIPYIVNDAGTLKYNEYTVRTVTADAWNSGDKTASVTLSNSDKTATLGTATGSDAVRSTTTHPSTGSDKFYVEIVVVEAGGTVGLQNAADALNSVTNNVRIMQDGSINRVSTPTGGNIGAPVNGDILSIAWDASTDKIWFRRNAGSWAGTANGDPVAGTNGIDLSTFAAGNYAIRASFPLAGDAYTIRTEAAEYTQTKPSGFLSWMGETLGPAGFTMAAATGVFAVAGQDVTLTKVGVVTHYTMPADTGAITLAGQPVGVRVGRKLIAGTGAFVAAGQAVTLRRTRVMPAALRAIAVAGQDVTLTKSTPFRIMPAATGAITTAGQAVALRVGRKLVAGTGAIAKTGQPAGLQYGRKLVAAKGAIAVAGQDVTLTKSTPVTHRSMPADTGALALAGQAVVLRASRKLIAGTGAVTSTGNAVTLRRTRVMPVTAGAFALAGQPVTFRRTRVMPVTAGAFALTGQSVALVYADNEVMTAGTGAVAFAGQPVTFRYTRVMPTAAGAFTLSGKNVTLTIPPREFLWPNADTSLGGWTNEVGGTTGIYQSIDEVTFNDLDYIQSPPSASVSLAVRLFDGATEIVEWTHTPTEFFVTAEQVLTAPQVAAISNFANLFVEFDDGNSNVYRMALSNPAAGGASPVMLRYRYKTL